MNKPFLKLTAIAVPLLSDNIDTDQVIPSREMTSVFKTGLADGLFAGQRYIKDREPNPDFILNQAPYSGANIVLSGANFGCGSSREHAVWALKEYGIRAIIAESFGEIFYNNSIRNGLLPIALTKAQIASLPREVSIDLSAQTVNGHIFEISEGDKAMLIGGLDVISLTLEHQSDIAVFLETDKLKRPWIYA